MPVKTCSVFFTFNFNASDSGFELVETWGTFHSTKTSGNFETEIGWFENVLERVPEISEIVEFPKSEPFNQLNGKSEIPGNKFPLPKVSEMLFH